MSSSSTTGQTIVWQRLRKSSHDNIPKFLCYENNIAVVIVGGRDYYVSDIYKVS